MDRELSSIYVLYHFFYPDDVVSAKLFSDFAEELAKRGWKVQVLTSNRYCCYPKKKIDAEEEKWKSIKIIRTYRPGWSQAGYVSRLANSIWIMIAWLGKLLTMPKADILIMGSDPQFSQLLFPVLKILGRQRFLVYWCYDLYPEALISESSSKLIRWAAKKMAYFMKFIYKPVDLIVDIGPCMRKRFEFYKFNGSKITLTPWALIEPEEIKKADPATKYKLFGNAKLALLYSGNMGKAHDFSLFLKLARKVYKENPEIIFCFSCRGNRFSELKSSIRPTDYNIRLVPFANEAELEQRLNSADIHLLSLKPGWEGIVVPSKFFGSLAVGKPVLYAGPEGSSIAEWISKFDVGLILTEDNLDKIAMELLELAKNPTRLHNWGRNAFEAYRRYFSKRVVMDKWDNILHNLLLFAKGFKK